LHRPRTLEDSADASIVGVVGSCGHAVPQNAMHPPRFLSDAEVDAQHRSPLNETLIVEKTSSLLLSFVVAVWSDVYTIAAMFTIANADGWR